MASQLSAKLSLDVKGFEQGMQDAKQSTEQYQTQLGDLSKKFPSMRKEMAQTKKAVMDMEVAWRSMSDAQKKSFEGQELQRQLQTLKERGAELKDAIMDVNQEMKNMASDTRQLDAVKQGFDVLGNSISLAANAYAAFTGDSEDAKRALTIFAGVQSTVNTLTALQNALQEQSSFMLGITTMQQKLKTKAVELDTAAQGKNIVATKGATAAQWALNLAADANPYVLLASAVIALVGAYAMFSDEINKAIGIQNNLTKKEIEFRDELKNQSSELAKTTNNVYKLSDEWKGLKTEAEQKQWIEDNQAAFDDLGISINSVTDAENVFVKNTSKFLAALEARTKAAAYDALANKKLQEAIDKGKEADIDPTIFEKAWAQIKSTYGKVTSGNFDKTLEGIGEAYTGLALNMIKNDKKLTNHVLKERHDEILELTEQSKEYLKNSVESLEDYNNKLTEAGIKQANKKKPTSNTPKSNSKKTDTWSPIDMSSIQLPKIDIHFGYNQSELDKKIKKLKDQLAGIPIRLDTEIDRAKLQKEIDKLEGIKSSKSFNESLNDDFNKHLVESQKALGETQKRIDDEDKKRLKEKADEQIRIYDAIGQSAQGVGSIMSSLSQLAEDESFNTAGIIMEAVANIALSFAKAMKDHKSFTIWDWIAAGIAGTAQMLSMIATIKSATQGYANGGIVGGSSYNGDRVLVRVNSGERILTAKQNKSLNSVIEQIDSLATTGGKLYGTVTVKGSDLNIAMKNYNKTINKSH